MPRERVLVRLASPPAPVVAPAAGIARIIAASRPPADRAIRIGRVVAVPVHGAAIIDLGFDVDPLDHAPFDDWRRRDIFRLIVSTGSRDVLSLAIARVIEICGQRWCRQEQN
jgi:hypothetical protein